MTINADFYELMYRLEYLIRYSNVPRIHDESVASHSFFVCVILIDLSQYYSFDLELALLMAICHDMPEARTNDISHETQRLYPQIADALKEAEAEAAKELPRVAQRAIQEYRECDTPTSRFVHLADAMQCYQYSSHELQLGNKGYMHEVMMNSHKRVIELMKELEVFKNGG